MAFCLSVISRRFASRLVYSEYGVPCQVVRLEHFADPEVSGPDDVVIRMLAAPIHPADINTIQGTYPIKPALPAVAGGEGVGRVVAVGQRVTGFRIGDYAIPVGNMAGTWATHFKDAQDAFIKVPNQLSPLSAATLRTNPATAYRMLVDFVELQPGDTVIQNGANSAVGRAVIQIAKAMQLRTVNVVRDRPDLEALRSDLISLGADRVFSEKELRQCNDFKENRLDKARLALNCVGGDSSRELMPCLRPGGVHVTYGGMSLKPVITATSALIFQDLEIRGFWLSRWISQHKGSDQMAIMYSYLADLAVKGLITPPQYQLVRLDSYRQALEDTMKGFKSGKLILDLGLAA